MPGAARWTVANIHWSKAKAGLAAASGHADRQAMGLERYDGFQPLIALLTTAIIQFLERGQIEGGPREEEAIRCVGKLAGILRMTRFDAGASSQSPPSLAA